LIQTYYYTSILLLHLILLPSKLFFLEVKISFILEDFMSLNIGVLGTLGAIGGGWAGWWMGGLPGAAAMGQLGASAGGKLGAYIFGAEIIENVADRVLNKTLEITDRVVNHLLGGAVITGSWWLFNKNAQDLCISSPSHPSCDILMWKNAAVVATTEVIVIGIIASKAIYLCKADKEKPMVEIVDEEERLHSASEKDGMGITVRKLLHKSVDSSTNVLRKSDYS
jgi:hypothetical protein